jgi:hypothetical protein
MLPPMLNRGRSLIADVGVFVHSAGQQVAGSSFAETAFLLTVLIGGSWWAGRALALGGWGQKALFALTMVLVAWMVGRLALDKRLRRGFLSVELPVLLLLLSTIVIRRRTASDLALDPLDPAAQFRVLCIGAALMLGLAAFVSPPLPGTKPRSRLAPRPIRLYGTYVLVAVAGAMFSVNQVLTLYRVVELTAALIVLAGAYRAVGGEATRRMEDAVYWFVFVQLCAVWVGLLVAPDQALVYKLSTTKSPLKFELEGVLPALSANIVGARAVLLAVWSLARLVARRRAGTSPRSASLLLLFGLVTLVAAQYRTGYVAFLVGAGVIFGIRRKAVLVSGAVALMAVLLLVPSGIDRAKPYVLRGETTKEAGELSYRLHWWRDALAVWERSPVIGRGLLTASRFEVLTQSVFASTSDIHSTWVESLVGTGVVGFGLLLGSLLTTVARARRAARRPGGPVLPLVLLAVLVIRSITGNALESFSVECLLFLVIAFSLEDQPLAVGQPPLPAASERRVGESSDLRAVGGRYADQPPEVMAAPTLGNESRLRRS